MAVIKILHIVSVETENYYLNNLVDYSDNDKVAYSFITFGAWGVFAEQMQKRGCTVYVLDALHWKRQITSLVKLKKLIKRENPDIVHTHLFIPSFWGLMLAKWQKRKTVLTRHHSDALYVISSAVKRKIWLSLEKYINRKSDYIIAPSQMVYDILVKKENVATKKVSLIPYGQTTERFDNITAELIQTKRSELSIGNELCFVCVSRLFNRKGHNFLFEAMAALKKRGVTAILYLVGTGPHKEALEKMTAALGIADKVIFLGWRNDALAIMAAADVIVHPSLEDALSSAVIEAIMLEKPIVATDISGVRDTLDNGKYGVIVPPANSKAFENAIYSIVHDMPAAKEKATQGRRYLLEYMSAKRVATAYTDIYQQLIQ